MTDSWASFSSPRAPGGEVPAPAVVERIVQLDAAELRELGRRLRERLAAEA